MRKFVMPSEFEPAGNAYSIMGRVSQAMKTAFELTGNKDYNKEAEDAYLKAATSGDYDYLRKVSKAMLDKINEELGL